MKIVQKRSHIPTAHAASSRGEISKNYTTVWKPGDDGMIVPGLHWKARSPGQVRRRLARPGCLASGPGWQPASRLGSHLSSTVRSTSGRVISGSDLPRGSQGDLSPHSPALDKRTIRSYPFCSTTMWTTLPLSTVLSGIFLPLIPKPSQHPPPQSYYVLRVPGTLPSIAFCLICQNQFPLLVYKNTD